MSPVVPQQPFQPFQPFPVESPENPVLGLLRNFEGHLHDFSLAEPCGTPKRWILRRCQVAHFRTGFLVATNLSTS